jgi:hypothetical protein
LHATVPKTVLEHDLLPAFLPPHVMIASQTERCRASDPASGIFGGNLRRAGSMSHHPAAPQLMPAAADWLQTAADRLDTVTSQALMYDVT